MFPEYLMIGMTPEQYWDGEVGLLSAYLKAFRMRMEHESQDRDIRAWLIGRYVREALSSVALLVNGFVPKNVQPAAYPAQPFSIQEETAAREEARRQAEDAKIKQSMALFQAAVVQFNKNFYKRQEAAQKHLGQTPEPEGGEPTGTAAAGETT